MSDVPDPRTNSLDFSKEDVDITESDGPDLETGDDLDTGAAIAGEPGDDDLGLRDNDELTDGDATR